jgi:hypothetical protein
MGFNFLLTPDVAVAGGLVITAGVIGYYYSRKTQSTKLPLEVLDITYNREAHSLDIIVKNTSSSTYYVQTSEVRQARTLEEILSMGDKVPMMGARASVRTMWDLVAEKEETIEVAPGMEQCITHAVILPADYLNFSLNPEVEVTLKGERVNTNYFALSGGQLARESSPRRTKVQIREPERQVVDPITLPSSVTHELPGPPQDELSLTDEEFEKLELDGKIDYLKTRWGLFNKNLSEISSMEKEVFNIAPRTWDFPRRIGRALELKPITPFIVSKLELISLHKEIELPINGRSFHTSKVLGQLVDLVEECGVKSTVVKYSQAYGAFHNGRYAEADNWVVHEGSFKVHPEQVVSQVPQAPMCQLIRIETFK